MSQGSHLAVYTQQQIAMQEMYQRRKMMKDIGMIISKADQQAKADCGKPQLRLVPLAILPAIARVREYGNFKYHDPENWKTVSVERYRDAMMRHMMAYIEDPKGLDKESGLPHLWHLACNVAFLVSLEGELFKK